MHSTTHAVAGAALGYLAGRPAAAFAAGVASHLVMDVTPHYDPDSDLGYVLDSLGGTAAIAVVAVSRAVRERDPRRCALYGALGAALPDVELLRKLFNRETRPEQYLMPWHNGMLTHGQARPLFSTVSQAALWASLLAMAAAKARRVRRASGTAERGG